MRLASLERRITRLEQRRSVAQDKRALGYRVRKVPMTPEDTRAVIKAMIEAGAVDDSSAIGQTIKHLIALGHEEQEQVAV